MSKGALLFAFNSPKYNYYEMAVATAKRINHFLDMPVTVVTDEKSISDSPYKFDKTIIIKDDNNQIIIVHLKTRTRPCPVLGGNFQASVFFFRENQNLCIIMGIARATNEEKKVKSHTRGKPTLSG